MSKVTLKKRALETLRDANISRINFQYGRLRVYPRGYAEIADLIDADHIVYAPSLAGNSYDPTTAQGQRHVINVQSSLGRMEAGTLMAVTPFTADNRATIVHEATHALQDYQRMSQRGGAPILPRQFEGAAYLAGAMAALLWGFDSAPTPVPASKVIALDIARQVLNGTAGYVIDDESMRRLDRAVLTGSAHMYDMNGT